MRPRSGPFLSARALLTALTAPGLAHGDGKVRERLGGIELIHKRVELVDLRIALRHCHAADTQRVDSDSPNRDGDEPTDGWDASWRREKTRPLHVREAQRISAVDECLHRSTNKGSPPKGNGLGGSQ